MARKRSHYLPPQARYPLFFLGLLVIIVGGLVGVRFGLSRDSEVAAAVVGLILITASVAIR